MKTKAVPLVCKICVGSEHMVLYQGPIRMGRFGEFSSEPYTVWQCTGCGAGHLSSLPVDYASGEYRMRVDDGDTPEDFYRLHDAEQAEKLRVLGTDGLRDTVLMDVGCGAGSFLDLVKGYCRSTIGIEPTPSLRAVLTAKGHEAFPYCSDVPDAWNGRVDVAVLFSVIEHLEDPIGLLRDIRRVLKPGGRLLLSSPNRRDWLLELLPEEYGRFFYRAVHTWYFEAQSISKLVSLAGFIKASVSYFHRYDLSNAILWLRDKRPTGLGKLPLPSSWSEIFRGFLAATGRADYLYCWCVNP